MKLIDILVQELPKLGGWPVGADSIYQNAKGHLVGVQGCIVSPVDMELGVVAEDLHRSVTREQYESALASSKPEWDGEGLPPVGTRCEFISNDTSWGEVDVIGIDGDKVVFKPSGETYYGIAPSQRQIFRPIRSEADKKRDEAISAMRNYATNYNNTHVIHAIEQVYDAIAAGKIPHIRID